MPVPIASSLAHPWRHRDLIGILTRREIAGRYRGSLLGSLWSFLTPLLMLVVFTLVFGIVLAARWPGAAGSGGIGMFALVLLAGMLIHGWLSEVLSGAPGLIVGNPNYVTRMVFPVEALAWTSLLASGFNVLIGMVLLLLANGIWGAGFSAGQLALPLVLLPFAVLLLGLAWLFSALSVYLRDLQQLVSPLIMVLMFLGPVFFPRSAMPAALQPWLALNPITVPIEQVRRTLFDSAWPDWEVLGLYSLASVVTYLVGLMVFNKLKRGFADVL